MYKEVNGYAVLRLTNKSPAVAEMGDRGHNRHAPKRGAGLLCPFRGGSLIGPLYHNVARAEVYFRTNYQVASTH